MSGVEEKTLYLSELRNTSQQERLVDWWKELQTKTGNRAELRRCYNPEDAASKPDTFRLYNILGSFRSIESAATIAGLLSHLKPESEFDFSPFGKKLAKIREGGDRPIFSESRFRHLLKSRDWNDFYTNMRRAIVVLNGRVHPLYIADIVLRWDREQKPDYVNKPGQSLRFRLSQEYYNEIIRREEKK